MQSNRENLYKDPWEGHEWPKPIPDSGLTKLSGIFLTCYWIGFIVFLSIGLAATVAKLVWLALGW